MEVDQQENRKKTNEVRLKCFIFIHFLNKAMINEVRKSNSIS